MIYRGPAWSTSRKETTMKQDFSTLLRYLKSGYYAIIDDVTADSDLPCWPKRGDRLFDTENGALRVRNSGLHENITKGYKISGDILIECCAISGWRRDDILLPALFCYRQYLELKIKKIISRVDTGPPERIHNLKALWERLERVSVETMGTLSKEDQKTLKQARSCILELHNLDSKGTGLRYPNVISEFYINPLHFRRVVTDIANYLEAFHDYCTNGER